MQGEYFELVFVCLGIFLLMSFAISFLFIFNYFKIKRLIGGEDAHVQSVHFNRKPCDENKRNTLSTDLLDSRTAGYDTPRIPGTPVQNNNNNNNENISNNNNNNNKNDKTSPGINENFKGEIHAIGKPADVNNKEDSGIGIVNEGVDISDDSNGEKSSNEETYDFMSENYEILHCNRSINGDSEGTPVLPRITKSEGKDSEDDEEEEEEDQSNERIHVDQERTNETYAPLARAETESIASDNFTDSNLKVISDEEETDSTVHDSAEKFGEVAIEKIDPPTVPKQADLPNRNDVSVNICNNTVETEADASDGISCRGFIREVYNASPNNNSVGQETPEKSSQTPVQLRHKTNDTIQRAQGQQQQTQHTSNDTTLNRAVPAFVDKSLRKLLKLTTAVTAFSALYCVGIIYYICDVSKQYHWCKTDQKWMMEVDENSWLVYQTIARISELGMTSTMSYLVRRSGFDILREKFGKRKNF